jgi:biotin carboxylase
LPSQWILIVGGKHELVFKAQELGLRVLQLQDRNRPNTIQLGLAEHTVTANFSHVNETINLVRSLNTVIPFGSAISLSEDSLVLASKICEALNLPGTSKETTDLLKNKAKMRKLLSEVGLSPVLAKLGNTLSDLILFQKKCHGPVIVKPVDAAGSLGVFLVDNEASANSAFQELANQHFLPFLMEEYLDGLEISVEIFTFAGHHTVMAVTDKVLGHNFVEIGHTIPSRLDSQQLAPALKLTRSLLDAVGLADGPSHTEIKLTSCGPRVIESHNRVGGDHINELYESVSGLDMKQMALGWPFGLIEPLKVSPPLRGSAAIRFVVPTPGIVRRVSGFHEIASAEDVIKSELSVAPGDRVNPLRSSGDRCGYVLVRGRDATEATVRAEELVRQVRIDVEQ